MSPFQFKQLGGRLCIQIYKAWFKLWIVTSKSHTLRFRPGCLKEICWILLNHGIHLKSSSISSASILHVTICGIPGQRVAPRRNSERRATTGSRLNHMGNPKRSRWEIHRAWERTVRNTVWVLGYLLHQLVQDFFHQQYYRSNIITYTPIRGNLVGILDSV